MKKIKLSFFRSIKSKVVFISIGIAATAWFLIRVIPKPQRAYYPCMRATAPIMSSFVIWLLSVIGMAITYERFKRSFTRSKYLIAVLSGIAFLICFLLFESQNIKEIYAELIYKPTKGNSPVGVERGIFPGRVVWIYNPKAAVWNNTGNWWDDVYTIQSETDKMVSAAIVNISGKVTESEAWDTIFKSFNKRRTGTALGYQSGQKIAIKINQNNASSQANSNNINGCPQMILSLLKSLINQAGVADSNITVFDASRFITDNIYTKCHAVFSKVKFVDNIGGNGRIKATYVSNAIPFSISNGNVATGIASCAVNADYLIDMALLKGHVYQGVTLCGKNWFGATSISSDYTKNAHDHFSGTATDGYLTFVDYMGHKNLGDKTVLFLIDGLYGCKALGGAPSPKWQMAPFKNNWTSSLFASQDGVAIDAVGIDFLESEFPDLPDATYADKYLVEASQANNPPSGTFYDPEKDGSRLPSLGVFEHWNNSTDKKYSRNLGLNYGIELYQKIITASTPPVIAIDSPADNSTFITGNTVLITGTSSDPDGTVSKVELYDGSKRLGTATGTTSWTYSIINISGGGHVIKAIATDNSGTTSETSIKLLNNDLPDCTAPAIVLTNTSPVIDQTIDSEWATAPSESISLAMTGTTVPAGFSASWRSLFTTANIYFLVEVTKTGALYNQNGTNWWQDDAVEIFIDADNSKKTTYDGVNDFQYGFRFNDGTNIQTGGKNPANSTIGITYKCYTTTSGYNVEISIPWSTLKITPVAGNQIGMEVAVDVSSGAARTTQVMSFNNSGQSYINPSLFGSVMLSHCGSITSIEQKKNEKDISVFSYNGILKVVGLKNKYLLTVYDIQGAKVYSSKTTDNTEYITFLKNGIYFVTVNGKTVSKKVLVLK